MNLTRPLSKNLVSTNAPNLRHERTDEGTHAATVEIGRKSEVEGPVRAQRVIIGEHAHAESIYGKGVLLRTGAEAENVYGERITIDSHCHINSVIWHADELRPGEGVSLARDP